MKEKIRNNEVYIMIALFLSCYFAQLFNFQMLWMLAGCGVFCLYFFIKQKTLRLDVGICLLAITMYSYYIMQYGARAVVTMIPYVPMIMYVMSNYLSGDIKKTADWEKKFLGILFCLIIGYTIHGLLNSYLYYAGYVKSGTRQWYDIWTQTYMPGTQHNLFYLPVLAVVFPSIIWFRKHKIINLLVIACSLFFVYTSLITKSRMSIVIFAMIFFGEAILYFMLENKNVKKILSNKKIWMIIAGGIVAVIVLFYLLKDIAFVSEFINNFSRGGGILNNVRFKLQAKALSQLFEFPFGGRQMDLYVKYHHMYIHNVWLDMANMSGVIPFFAFTAFTIYSAINLIRFLVKKEISAEVKVVTAGLYMTFFLFYFVEPALDASIHYVTPWMLINGMIQGILRKDGIKLNFLRRTNEE